jgi:hypothetical protein
MYALLLVEGVGICGIALIATFFWKLRVAVGQ